MKITFKANGMQCNSCESIIQRTAMKIKGVKSCNAVYATEICEIEYNSKITSKEEIFEKINDKGYDCQDIVEKEKNSIKTIFGWIFGIGGVLLILYFLSALSNMFSMPNLTGNLSLGLIFGIGLITGFHCVSMCGGFVVSYSTKDAKNGKSSYFSHVKYGVGKTLSYTIIGAIFGFVGSIIAFTPMMRGVVGIMAGLFLIIYGLKMLNVFPTLRKFGIKTPKKLFKFISKSSGKNRSNPFIIGLLNGLMIACGPLQAIYIMAAGTGSAIEGAKILFLFGLGTLPVLLSFGVITTLISANNTRKILKGSAYIVIILGLFMLNDGITLTGTGLDFNSVKTSISTNTYADNQPIESNENLGVGVLKDGYQEITMEVNRYGWSPDTFIIQKDIPVKWIINGKEINGCNNAIQVPAYNLEFDNIFGQQIIEFTPDKTGTIAWSCWMGMIPGTFIVKDKIDQQTVKTELNNIINTPKQRAPSCGGSGGGCGCGSGK